MKDINELYTPIYSGDVVVRVVDKEFMRKYKTYGDWICTEYPKILNLMMSIVGVEAALIIRYLIRNTIIKLTGNLPYPYMVTTPYKGIALVGGGKRLRNNMLMIIMAAFNTPYHTVTKTYKEEKENLLGEVTNYTVTETELEDINAYSKRVYAKLIDHNMEVPVRKFIRALKYVHSGDKNYGNNEFLKEFSKHLDVS